jgi:hypothetical protein
MFPKSKFSLKNYRTSFHLFFFSVHRNSRFLYYGTYRMNNALKGHGHFLKLYFIAFLLVFTVLTMYRLVFYSGLSDKWFFLYSPRQENIRPESTILKIPKVSTVPSSLRVCQIY